MLKYGIQIFLQSKQQFTVTVANYTQCTLSCGKYWIHIKIWLENLQ